ncbi:MAG: hypothetical protein PUJ51_02535 [Clostridiales bacterium]|uniref:hypothetical protein n=1 Tax=Terrisporobacter sp. TaxID=1965305 RepID=UPI002A5232B6|nr:hypothetical protein [Terrisporobacter sp.]MDD7753371.1 hypothetical protein [Clostridiales bacterium]MDY4136080.1 hypothetical protein [Terrisporobacter sp.]
MEEMLKLLEEEMNREVEQKNHIKELNVLGLMSDEEVERLSSVYNYAISRLNKIRIEVYNKYNNNKTENAK